MSSYYESTILRIGDEASLMVDGGVLIFFSEPVPDALEEMSVVHAPAAELRDGLQPGDRLRLGDGEVEVTHVGERATENLRSIGHVVVYLNPDDDSGLLPGAVHARGRLPAPEAGTTLALSRG